uniref:ParE toxin of type II toxin-antitoxin system, parDE n=1 Tax=Candidatus Kentrum sp. LPFa TaxID=2126335 RepID=A0A450VZE3_9GAMM|nr:MAG: ParE toxin of type II toxin-antitoxin system, parDE [Candidatus Kentron sp. LPFa]
MIDYLPEQASWDDILYELYVKQKIEEGLADIEAAPSPTNKSRPSCWAMATIKWSRRAKVDIRDSKAYIAGTHSQYYARHFTERIIASVENLETFPKMGR